MRHLCGSSFEQNVERRFINALMGHLIQFNSHEAYFFLLSLLKQIQTNSGNSTEHGEQTNKIIKSNRTS